MTAVHNFCSGYDLALCTNPKMALWSQLCRGPFSGNLLPESDFRGIVHAYFIYKSCIGSGQSLATIRALIALALLPEMTRADVNLYICVAQPLTYSKIRNGSNSNNNTTTAAAIIITGGPTISRPLGPGSSASASTVFGSTRKCK